MAAAEEEGEPGALAEGEDVHGLDGVDDERREVVEAGLLEAVPAHVLGFRVDLDEVDGLAAGVEAHLVLTTLRRR